jgi:DNA polymerase III delta subunit
MNDNAVRAQVQQGEISSQYILIGAEPLIMEKTIEHIEQNLHIDRTFDYETFSLAETPIEEVLSKVYSTAFSSSRRLIVAKNLEELDTASLTEFADTINEVKTGNCLVMLYRLSKDEKKVRSVEKKLEGLFVNARCVTYRSDKNQVRNWIEAKVRKDNLPLSTAMMRYLEDEFSNDITGLKNEFDKIENYLSETSSISTSHIQDLAKGLCDFNAYQMIDSFLKGNANAVTLFVELQPYIRAYPEIVGALTWRIMYNAQHAYSVLRTGTMLRRLLHEVADLDKSVKTGSLFVQTKLELFFLKNARVFKKGAVYG